MSCGDSGRQVLTAKYVSIAPPGLDDETVILGLAGVVTMGLYEAVTLG